MKAPKQECFVYNQNKVSTINTPGFRIHEIQVIDCAKIPNLKEITFS